MSDYPHLSRAPITEALIDIRVTLPGTFGLADLEPYCSAVSDQYPDRRVRQQWKTQLQITKESPSASPKQIETRTVGYLLSSKDRTQVIQARLDGFAFSRLPPYTEWTAVRREALRLWRLYVELLKPVKVSRLAVRYINRLPLPSPVDFKDFVLTGPEIAPGLPQQLAGFLMQLRLPFTEENAVATLTETVEPAPPGHVSVILDIDVVRFATFEPGDDEVWTTLDALRDVKNRIFFKTLTPRALDLFK